MNADDHIILVVINFDGFTLTKKYKVQIMIHDCYENDAVRFY